MESTPDRSSQVTLLLREASHGNREAMDRLIPLVYDELKVMGQAKLRREPDGHTLNATALVHEVYVSLVEQERVTWESSAHFFAVASLAMRRILVSHARAHLAAKRGGGESPVSLDEVSVASDMELFSDEEATDLLTLNDALGQLKDFNPDGAAVVEYRFFGGLRHREIAQVTGVSEVTVRRRWTAAKAWLRTKMGPGAMQRTQTLVTPSLAS